jgi:hypothetical protein
MSSVSGAIQVERNRMQEKIGNEKWLGLTSVLVGYSVPRRVAQDNPHDSPPHEVGVLKSTLGTPS